MQEKHEYKRYERFFIHSMKKISSLVNTLYAYEYFDIAISNGNAVKHEYKRYERFFIRSMKKISFISEYLTCLFVMTFPLEKPAFSRLPFLAVSRDST